MKKYVYIVGILGLRKVRLFRRYIRLKKEFDTKGLLAAPFDGTKRFSKFKIFFQIMPIIPGARWVHNNTHTDVTF